MELVMDIKIHRCLYPLPLWERVARCQAARRERVCARLQARLSFRRGWSYERIINRRRRPVRRLVFVGNPRQLLPRLLSLTLLVPHTGIKSARRQKLGVSSALDDTALIQNDDF